LNKTENVYYRYMYIIFISTYLIYKEISNIIPLLGYCTNPIVDKFLW